jgi:hypothetical protein
VVGFGALAQLRILDFHEVADMRMGGKVGARTHARVGADARIRADARAVDVAERQYPRAGLYRRIL